MAAKAAAAICKWKNRLIVRHIVVPAKAGTHSHRL
jgi:hypothetical protein